MKNVPNRYTAYELEKNHTKTPTKNKHKKPQQQKMNKKHQKTTHHLLRLTNKKKRLYNLVDEHTQ